MKPSLKILVNLITLYTVQKMFWGSVEEWLACVYTEDITRWREDMNFMFEWQEQYLTSERSFCHENIKYINFFQAVTVTNSAI